MALAPKAEAISSSRTSPVMRETNVSNETVEADLKSDTARVYAVYEARPGSHGKGLRLQTGQPPQANLPFLQNPDFSGESFAADDRNQPASQVRGSAITRQSEDRCFKAAEVQRKLAQTRLRYAVHTDTANLALLRAPKSCKAACTSAYDVRQSSRAYNQRLRLQHPQTPPRITGH